MITGINHLTFSVLNLEQSFAFYNNVLGFRPVQKSPTSAYLLAGDLWIALVKDDQIREISLPEYTHTAFTISSQDFPLMKQRLIDAGVVEWQTNWTEGDSFYFLDPNGHKLEIHVSHLEARIANGKQNWGDQTKWFI